MQSYKAGLRESIRKLEDAKRVRPLNTEELEVLEELRDKYDCNQIYLNESGMAYDS